MASRFGKSTRTAVSEMSGTIFGGSASKRRQLGSRKSWTVKTLDVIRGRSHICRSERLKGGLDYRSSAGGQYISPERSWLSVNASLAEERRGRSL